MLTNLFESRARPQRRRAGAALSLITHATILASAVGATQATPLVTPADTARDRIIWVPRPDANPAPVVHPATAEPILPQREFTREMSKIAIPVITPPTLPPIDAPVVDAELWARERARAVVAAAGASIGTATSSGAGVYAVGTVDKAARLTTVVRPRYPEVLRNAGVSGRVVIHVVVDTLGRAEMNTLQVMESTHDAFSATVREAVGRMRFTPAEANGQRVRMLVEMPFDFQIER